LHVQALGAGGCRPDGGDSAAEGRWSRTGKATSSGSPPSCSQAGPGSVGSAAGGGPGAKAAARDSKSPAWGAGEGGGGQGGPGAGVGGGGGGPGAGGGGGGGGPWAGSTGASSRGGSASGARAAVVPAGRIRSSSRSWPAARAARTAAVLRPRSNSRRSAWK